MSRLSRLYPAYWIALLLTASVLTVRPRFGRVGGWDVLLTNLTMIQHGLGVRDVDGSYWSLFAELKFYALFAIVVARGVTYRRCVLFCVLWTGLGVVDYDIDNKLVDMWAMPLYSPYFVAGIAFYLMHRFRPTAVLWGIVLVSFLLGEHQMARRVAFNLADPAHPIAVWPARLALAALFLLMALVAVGAFDRVRWRRLTTAGALTYPLYLIHENIGLTVIQALRDRLPAAVLVSATVALMLLVAWVLHRVGERPLTRIMRRALRDGMEEMRNASAEPGTRRRTPQAPAAGSHAPRTPARDAAHDAAARLPSGV